MHVQFDFFGGPNNILNAKQTHLNICKVSKTLQYISIDLQLVISVHMHIASSSILIVRYAHEHNVYCIFMNHCFVYMCIY